MKKNEYVCSICGEVFTDMNKYSKHVVECVERENKIIEEKKQKERLEKLNIELNSVKEAKNYFEDKLNEFKKNYPDEYELNFGDKKCSDNHDCKCKGVKIVKDKDGNIKRKELDTLDDLINNYEEVRSLAKLFGILN